MSNDATRNQLTELMGLLSEQMADISAMQKKQAVLRANGAAADDMVKVMVNAQGHLVKIEIDESYLDEHEFDELCDHITEAAKAAVQSAARLMDDLMTTINQRRKAFPGLSDIVDGAPDLRDLVERALAPDAAPSPRGQANEDAGDENSFPTVRR
jgi:DNA-binding YbaB/EbfC family protein